MAKIFNFPEQLSQVIWVFISLLTLATIIFQIAHKLKSNSLTLNLVQRTNSWWVIFALYILLFGVNPVFAYIGFCFISYSAHREMISNLNFSINVRRVVFWSYLAIPAQYLIIYKGDTLLFNTFIPVFMLFILTVRMILDDNFKESINVFSRLHWSLMITTFFISHIVHLLSLPNIPNVEQSFQYLVFFLIFVSQTNDIFQYIFGKIFGKVKIAPNISPSKTYVGFFGGIVGTLCLSYALSSLMPMSLIQTLCLGLIISITGFLGDLMMSAIKRNLGVKDMSNFIPGHGGVLDRLDSLVFSAPIYFYIIYFWIYT